MLEPAMVQLIEYISITVPDSVIGAVMNSGEKSVWTGVWFLVLEISFITTKGSRKNNFTF
jgi:hypothetical protein